MSLWLTGGRKYIITWLVAMNGSRTVAVWTCEYRVNAFFFDAPFAAWINSFAFSSIHIVWIYFILKRKRGFLWDKTYGLRIEPNTFSILLWDFAWLSLWNYIFSRCPWNPRRLESRPTLCLMNREYKQFVNTAEDERDGGLKDPLNRRPKAWFFFFFFFFFINGLWCSQASRCTFF